MIHDTEVINVYNNFIYVNPAVIEEPLIYQCLDRGSIQ